MTPQRRGEAGRRGKEIRSDVWASVELLGSGGVELDMRSRVEPYFGDAIRTQVTSLLEGLGIEHARIEIEDSGALPFVIAGRIEAAARQAGLDPGCGGLPERTAQDTPGTSRSALRRSRLYLPGNEPKYFLNAGLYSPDGVILDLEDSVHAEGKLSARLLVRNALRVVDFKGAERMVRINQLPLGLEDLEAVVPEHPDLILVPKVETADQVREVEQAIDRQIGDSKRSLWLMPIIENALGVENAFDIAAASPRIAALTIGLEDYAADMGVPRSADGRESLYARLRLVNAAKAAGIQAIDSVYGQVDDMEGLTSWARSSRGLGFQGMGCLHPRQIAVVHDAFNPSRPEVERALKIVAAFAEAEAKGHGVVSLGSKMIDPPVVEQARRLVQQARAAGLVPADSPE